MAHQFTHMLDVGDAIVDGRSAIGDEELGEQVQADDSAAVADRFDLIVAQVSLIVAGELVCMQVISLRSVSQRITVR